MPRMLQRRSLLKMAAASACALPVLELTHPRKARAADDGIPTRYVFMFAGMSTGRAGSGDQITPSTTGPGYELPRSLLPLGAGALPYGGEGSSVVDDVSVVSGLKIPWGGFGQTPPPGGKSPEFHRNTVGQIVSGVRGNNSRTGYARGPSSDQVVARHIADDAHRHLVYRAQPVMYVGSNGGGGDDGRLSWKEDEGGNLMPEESNASPRLAYESLFSTFVPPDDAAGLAALDRRRSVLDMVRAQTESLLPRLGAADRARMDQHFEQILALQSRADEITPVGGSCTPPADPGEDPVIGQAHGTGGNGLHQYTEGAAYSDEDLRAELLGDLVHMAMACDQSRVAAVRMTFDQCFMNMQPLFDYPADVHDSSHGAAPHDAFADAVGWHVKHFARLIAKLRDTEEFDGSSMLDNTAVVLQFEGGYGYDPEGNASSSPHSTENMVALVGGRAGGLTPGQHIVATDAHPAAVTLTAMQAVGADVPALGEVSETVPALMGG